MICTALFVIIFAFSDLQLNHLICDCNLKWIIKWIANLKNRGTGKTPSVLGRCEHPFAVKDKKIVDLSRKEMVCGKNEHCCCCYKFFFVVVLFPVDVHVNQSVFLSQ